MFRPVRSLLSVLLKMHVSPTKRTAMLDGHVHRSVQHSENTDRLNCRVRHLKCDEQRPSCTRCEKAGIECVRGYNIRFRHGANPSIASKGPGPARSDLDFSKTQPWVKTARNLTFLDETQELISIYDHAAEPETDYTAVFQWPESTGTPSGPSSGFDTHSAPRDSPATVNSNSALERVHSTGHADFARLSSPAKRRRLTTSGPYNTASTSPANSQGVLSHVFQSISSPAKSWHASPHNKVSPHSGWTPQLMQDIEELTGGYGADSSGMNVDTGDGSGYSAATASADASTGFASLEPTVSLGQQTFNAVSDSLSRIYLDTPVWPLEKKEEAYLLRYYVENLSRNFDLTDSLKHFRYMVPQRAATCPTLLNAILALSARHLSRVGKYDPLVSNKYHQECLKHLIPMLDDTTAILDENLLASTIILRHLEEIEVPLSGQSPADQQSHLFGAHAFMMSQEHVAMAGGLRQAAFWVGLRQEIYVAFVNQRSIIPDLTHCNVDRSFDAAPDDVWACRMVVLCADVIRWCFGSEDHNVSTYTYLADMVAQWHASKPPPFTPIYYAPPGPDNVFPELWYVQDDVLVGLHHYHIARILLASYNPRIPRLGPGRAVALREMDQEIKEHVLAGCGMTLSNSSMAPNFTYASMGVTMAGDKFTDRREQEALMDILRVCDEQYGWPTGHATGNLKLAWGWE
ncbi:hypothetical protein KC340_g6201 [Hortaea werneckii]|nr:hypothetical protein KC340_g6201 [Hortaea werneckii]